MESLCNSLEEIVSEQESTCVQTTVNLSSTSSNNEVFGFYVNDLSLDNEIKKFQNKQRDTLIIKTGDDDFNDDD